MEKWNKKTLSPDSKTRVNKIMRLIMRRFPSVMRRMVREIIWKRRFKQAYEERIHLVPNLLRRYGIQLKKTFGPQHVILIVIDSLRKDHLSLYGYKRQTTPHLDTIAEQGAVFERVISPASWTYPAVASILTGLYPHNHGGTYPGTEPRDFTYQLPNVVRRDVISLPDILKLSDFESFIVTGITPAAMASIGWFKHSSVFFGIAEQHIGRFLKWLRRNRTSKTFSYLHLSDLHVPIHAPQQYRNLFGPIAKLPKLEGWQYLKDLDRQSPAFQAYRENRETLYDCALRYVDAQIARIFDFLKMQDSLDSSLVIVTADHGDEFWDHAETEYKLFFDPRGYYGAGHGHSLFQEVIAVPLICAGHGIAPGRYYYNVSLVDIMPTILNICGIQHDISFSGQDLFERSDDRPLIATGVCYGYEKAAIIKNNWKLIHSEGDKLSLLFDMANDPKEQHDLAQAHPDIVERLKAALPAGMSKRDSLKMTRDVEEQLRDLGYI